MSTQTETQPTHKHVSCPQCGAEFLRAIIWWHGRELMADRGCLCDKCEAAREAGVKAASDHDAHLTRWRNRVPDDYHRATKGNVPLELQPALDWRPEPGCLRLGIIGTAGKGKTMAVALLVKDLGIQFRWTNGFAARSLWTKAVSAEDQEERKEAALQWRRITSAPLLVLDDIDKGNFTEAWAAALFDLLESRNGNQLPTIWTANLGPGRLSAKFGRCGDPEMAQAIERRLCQGGKLIQAV